MRGMLLYEVRKLHNVPGSFDEMLARSYACRKHSLAAATVHFWPGGSFSIRLGHARICLFICQGLANMSMA